jgi:3',5'-cyclic-AMP phosphodiesterase
VSTRPSLVAQISDLHVKPRGELAYDRVDTASALRRCIEQLNRFLPRPDLVVITGDLVDRPSTEAYEHLKALLAPLEIPFVATPGNHDDRDLTRAAFSKQRYATAHGPLNLATAVGPLDIVLIDSGVPGKDYGEVDADTLTWLDAQLAASSTRPALLFLHHPPFVTGIQHMDVQNLRNADRLAAVLRSHDRTQLVASGHVHRATLAMFAGIPATTCPAPNHAVVLDLDKHLPPSFDIEPPAFHLHAWFHGERFGSVVTHCVPIGEFDGPYPFFDPEGTLL